MGISRRRATIHEQLFAVVHCAGEETLDEPLDIASSPLQLAFGDTRGAFARGAIIGNLVLCLSCLADWRLVCVVGFWQSRSVKQKIFACG